MRFRVDHFSRSYDRKRIFLTVTCLTEEDADLLARKIREALRE